MAIEQQKTAGKPSNAQSNGMKRKRPDGQKTNNPLHNKKIKLLESRKKLPIWARQQDIVPA